MCRMKGMEETVIWVDERNEALGVVSRLRMRRERLAHRASFVYIFRSSGLLVAQRRTRTKDVWPGYIDLAAGGVVQAGETYLESAHRELQEEMGVAGADLTERFDFWIDHADARAWGRVYTCLWDGELRLQAEEVELAFEVSVEDALAGKLEGPVTPDSLEGLQRLARDFLKPGSAPPISSA